MGGQNEKKRKKTERKRKKSERQRKVAESWLLTKKGEIIIIVEADREKFRMWFGCGPWMGFEVPVRLMIGEEILLTCAWLEISNMFLFFYLQLTLRQSLQQQPVHRVNQTVL